MATILSAQSTDKRVNLVTPIVFARYPDAAALRRGGPDGAGGVDQADRVLPGQDRQPDQARRPRWSSASTARCRPGWTTWSPCPASGRKTANVVLGNAFGVPGITVDTHVGRLSRRFGWTTQPDPDKVEAEIGGPVPAKGLDPALPQRDLARPPPLPRPQPRLRRLPGRPLVPLVR